MSEKVLLVGSYSPIHIDLDVAVVGSSVTMIGRGYGEQIDKHAEVVRFNFAKIKGYEADFGSRETIRLWTLTHKRLAQFSAQRSPYRRQSSRRGVSGKHS